MKQMDREKARNIQKLNSNFMKIESRIRKNELRKSEENCLQL